jgi:hypothetical protein
MAIIDGIAFDSISRPLPAARGTFTEPAMLGQSLKPPVPPPERPVGRHFDIRSTIAQSAHINGESTC